MEGDIGFFGNVAFWVFATVAVIGALGTVAMRKAVHSAIMLAMTMIVIAVLYIMQGALFLGVVQIVVYTGAVMMLFLFVLMLVGVDSSDSLTETIRVNVSVRLPRVSGSASSPSADSAQRPSKRLRTRATAPWPTSPN